MHVLTNVYAGVLRGSKRALHSGAGVRGVVSHTMWVLGTPLLW